MTTARFQHCLKIVLGHEGGYSDHKADRGGKTNYGVTQKTYSAFLKSRKLPERDVRDIHESEVEAIYHDYWKEAHCAVMPVPLDLAHMDFAINAGATRANKTLQRVLGVPEDGIVGRDTLAALHEDVLATSVAQVISAYMKLRRNFYVEIVRKDARQKAFLTGWLARCDHLEDVMNLPVEGSL